MDNLIAFDISEFPTVDEKADIKVNNAGHYTINDKDYHTARPQGRADYQIIYLVKGKMQIFINGKENVILPGTLVIFRPNEPQDYIYLHEQTCETYWVHFYGSMIPKIFSDLKLNDVNIANIGIDYKIPKLISTILTDLIADRFGSNYSMIGILVQLLSIVGFYTNKPTNNYSGTDAEKFYDVLIAMKETTKGASLDKYAKMCNLSVSRFSHLFKETFGVSPYYYQTKSKIDKAKSLLEMSNLSIKEISDILGFEDAFYFSRIFKKYTDKSPTDYRKESIFTDNEDKTVLDNFFRVDK